MNSCVRSLKSFFGLTLITVLMAAVPRHQLLASDSTAVQLGGIGIGVRFPAATYRQYMRRASPSLSVNYLTSVRHPDFYVGGQLGFDIHDHLERNYRRIGPDGFTYDSEETVDVSSADLVGECRYMPDIAGWIQPFAGLRAGLRVTISGLTEANPDAQVGQSNTLYTNMHNAWVMQYGALGGFIVHAGNIFIELQASYMEAQPGRHLVRKTDWKQVNHSSPLDLFREVRTLQQFWGVHIRVLFPL